MGYYCGTFRENYPTIPTTGRPVYLRYGEVHRVEGGKIVEGSCLWDLLDLIRQAGFWPIDIIELLLQMDIDVFARMRSLFERGILPK